MALFCVDYFLIRSVARHWLAVEDDADYLVRLVFQGQRQWHGGHVVTSFVPLFASRWRFDDGASSLLSLASTTSPAARSAAMALTA